MSKKTIIVGFASAAALAVSPAAFAQAQGSPQRADKIPPGLSKAFSKQIAGIMNAIEKTEGSNSRLQDLPVSP